MEKLEKLENNTIVITEYPYKLDLLKKLNKEEKLFNIKFMDMKELIERIYFYYDEKAIYYLMKNYSLKREIASIYLQNLYYIEEKDYNNEKLSSLVKIKKELKDNNLLYCDEYFLDYLKNKKIIFYNYNYFNKLENSIITKLSSISNVSVIKKEYNYNKHTIYEFEDIFEEVEYIAIEILKLIEKGINLSNIKLTNLDDDYLDISKIVFSMYNLEINNASYKLISTKVASSFLSEKGTIKEKVEKLKPLYKDNEIFNKIIKVVNKYIIFEDNDIVEEMIKYDLKNTLIPSEKKQNTIEVIDYKNYPINDNMYVFMPNFNQNSIPTVYKDEEFITDNLKDNLLLDTTLVKNKNERESTINNILNIKNLVITYKTKTPFGSFYPSNLINDLGFEVVKSKVSLDTCYSTLSFNLRTCKYLDNYLKTGSITDDLKHLYSNYPNTSYNSYNNRFKGIDKKLFKEYLDNHFNLAYSSMDNFYKCPFRYYLANVLKLDIYEERFEAYLGSLFHYVLENGLKEEKDALYFVDKFISENERVLSKKEKFFIDKLKKELIFVLDFIKKQLDNSNLKDMLFEKRIEVNKNYGDFSVTFKGFIDKIMYKKDGNRTITAIIDYKTGYTDIDLGYVPFGLSMQLPVYLYLAKNFDSLDNVVFSGFYLQRVLNSEVGVNPKKSYEDLKKENVLLYGYSNSDQDLLYEFDNTYKNSQFIKSMRLDSKGEFSRYSKTLSNEEIENLVKITDSKIEDAVKGICNASFDIAPKREEKENLGCKYCKFSDICFKEVKDEVYIAKDTDLSFLGGANNA